MKISHKISFPGLKEFEQHSANFTLEESDVSPEALNGCNLLEKMFLFNVLVLYEGLLFQHCEGYISNDDLSKRKKRIFGLLSKKLLNIVKDLMKEGVTNGRD